MIETMRENLFKPRSAGAGAAASSMQKVCDPRHLQLFRAMRIFLVLCCLAAMNAASAIPADIVLVLDNSGSMRKNDPEFLLKRAVARFVNSLEAGSRLGIVVFDAAVNVAVPLHELDVETRAEVQSSLDGIDYSGQLTNSPAAVERAIYELRTAGRGDIPRVIVFMTDGIVDTGDAGADLEKARWLRDDLSALAARSGILIYGIAFTDNADFQLIQSLANRTSADYFRAPTPADLDPVFRTLEARLAARSAPALTDAEPAEQAVSAEPVVADPEGLQDGGTACLDRLPIEERIVVVESAPQLDMTPEALCLEMEAAAGSAASPAVEGASAEAPVLTGQARMPGWIMLVAGLVVLGAAVAFWLRRRGAADRPAGIDGASSMPEAFLKDLSGEADEPALRIGPKPVVVGRVRGSDTAHLDYFVINQGTVGRRHALIQYRDYAFWISDQGSMNGTFVNGQRIESERQLKHEDRILFHKFECEFSVPEMADAGHTEYADPGDLARAGYVDPDATVAVAGALGTMAASGSGAEAPAPGDGEVSAEAETAVFEEPPITAAEELESSGDLVATAVLDEPQRTDLPSNVAEPTPVATETETEKPESRSEDDDAFDAEASAFFDGAEFSGGTAATAEADDEFDWEAGAPGEDAGSEDETLIFTNEAASSSSGDEGSESNELNAAEGAGGDETLMPEQVADRPVAAEFDNDMFDLDDGPDDQKV